MIENENNQWHLKAFEIKTLTEPLSWDWTYIHLHYRVGIHRPNSHPIAKAGPLASAMSSSKRHLSSSDIQITIHTIVEDHSYLTVSLWLSHLAQGSSSLYSHCSNSTTADHYSCTLKFTREFVLQLLGTPDKFLLISRKFCVSNLLFCDISYAV